MKPVFFALIALFFYAVLNVIVEAKLSKVHPLANVVFYYIGALIIATIFFLGAKSTTDITLPHGTQWLFIVICGILLFIADYCFFSAYHSGGQLIVITTMVCLFPVMASFIKFLFYGTLPSLTQLSGWLLAAIGVYLVSKN